MLTFIVDVILFPQNMSYSKYKVHCNTDGTEHLFHINTKQTKTNNNIDHHYINIQMIFPLLIW